MILGGGFDSMRFKFEVSGLEEPAAAQRGGGD